MNHTSDCPAARGEGSCDCGADSGGRTWAEHRTMILSPDRWPRWPHLPIKRPDPTGNSFIGELGLLLATDKSWSTVYCVNLFDIPSTRDQFMATAKYRYDSVDELLADGWVVD